jgi:tetratricopeptide (TPR) repeat protein
VRIRLEDGKRVRQAARMAELPPESLRLIRVLVQARLLTTRGSAGASGDESLVEVTHEALFKAWPDLDQWLTEEQAFLIDLERMRGAHEVWSQAPPEQQPHALLQGLLLTRSSDWMMRYPQRFLGRDMAPLRAFVAASAAADDAERERAAAQQARTRRMERMLFRGAVAATAIFAVMAVGAGVAAWVAVKNEGRAARNFELTIDQADALVTKTSTELKDRIGISQDVIRRMLALIESQMDALAKVDERSPRLAVSRANMLSAFVENYIDLGDLQTARDRAQECVDIVRPLQGADGTGFEVTRALSGCLEKLANALAMRSVFGDAVKAYQESIALRRRLLVADPGNSALQLDLGHIMTYYSFALLSGGDIDEAFARAEEGLVLTRGLAGKDRQNTLWMREYVDSLNMRGMTLHEKGELADAGDAYREAIVRTSDLVAADRGNATLRRFLSNILANYSDVLLQRSESDEALTVLGRSVSLKRGLNAADTENATWDYELSVALIKLGQNQYALDKIDASLVSFDEACKRFKSLLQRDPGNGLQRWSLGECLWSMAVLNQKKGDDGAARASAQEALAMLQIVDLDHATEDFGPRMKGLRDKLREFLASAQAQ